MAAAVATSRVSVKPTATSSPEACSSPSSRSALAKTHVFSSKFCMNQFGRSMVQRLPEFCTASSAARRGL
ncbi:hypothetical protein [Spongiactinospora sp. TRM90649]|uniref:hypothetical protein n=1 Tax=Spongiactinospora sp. TRM90649 TaxID=3031114 RepID=UPI0023F89A1A|nr:hypothetical protein [Spongiactinospora sp. TRM90649]MDF5757347.1 hypothetical protein [Spongiactinospora sp. TRM90649]